MRKLLLSVWFAFSVVFGFQLVAGAETREVDSSLAGRFFGIGNSTQLYGQSALGPLDGPVLWNVYSSSFVDAADIPLAADWVFTEVEAGASDCAYTIIAPGAWNIRADSADDDSCQVQKATGSGTSGPYIPIQTSRSFSYFFEATVSVSDVAGGDDEIENSEWFVGLATTDTDVLTSTSRGIGFYKKDVTDDATNAIHFVSINRGIAAAFCAANTFCEDTGWDAIDYGNLSAPEQADQLVARAANKMGPLDPITLSFYVVPNSDDNTNSQIYVFVNGTQISGSPFTGQDGAGNDILPVSALMSPVFVIKNGAANAYTMRVHDYVVAVEKSDADGPITEY